MGVEGHSEDRAAVFELAGGPEFLRVFEEVESRSINRLEPGRRFSRSGDFLADRHLFCLHGTEAFFVSGNKGRLGFDDAVHQPLGGGVELSQFSLERIHRRGLHAVELIPHVPEHGLCERDHARRGLDGGQHVLELPFEIIAADGFPVFGAALGVAEIIRMMPDRAF